ncbi:MAG: metallophosphoesterase [Bacillus sp. (in: Bacteria)]|nr:metallophosphoesterase [Bacillus sp. (in: firmicutes)]MCM1427529.1 metallophosphoesterase [Eubacterium sp.]
MKVLIVSDTHRQNGNVLDVIEKVKPIDMLIHCGDVEGSEDIIAQAAGCPVQMVQGNNDFWSNIPREKEFMIGSYKVWLTHGHNYYVSMNYEIIKQEARSRDVDIVMCGHTHKPVVDIGADLTLINPGSMSFPRQEGRKPSYIIMEIDREGKAHYTIRYID